MREEGGENASQAVCGGYACSLFAGRHPCGSPGAGENAALIGQIGGSTYAVVLHGDYALIGAGPRLVVLDVSQPAQPLVAGMSEVLPGLVTGIAAAGGTAYIAEHLMTIWEDEGPQQLLGGLRLVDISNPSAPCSCVAVLLDGQECREIRFAEVGLPPGSARNLTNSCPRLQYACRSVRGE
ncbi:MAG: hypothetical protein ACP5TV_00455 [Anaerolineae bacterium]